MRRREYLRSTVAGLGLAGLATTAPPAAGDDASPSTHPARGVAPATGSTTLDPIARLPITNEAGGFSATEAVVAPDGQHVFVSKLTGFHVVDVSDPSEPEIVATRDGILADQGGPMGSIYDLNYSRGRLLLATEGGSPFTGIAVFDVTDREDPELVSSHSTGYSIHNCFLHGDYAYLTTGSSLDIVDVSVADPESVATWAPADHDSAYEDVGFGVANLHDMYVQDERAYLAYWDAGAWMLDVSDPTDPKYEGHAEAVPLEDLRDPPQGAGTEPPGNDHYVQPNDDGTVMAVGKESWDIDTEDDQGGPSGIALWDISDPADPTELSYIDPPPVPEGETAARFGGYYTTSHNFDIVGDYLYSSWYRGGVKVHDISDPENPEELDHWADGDNASMWTAQVGVPGEFFVGTSHQHPTDPDGPGNLYVYPDPSENDATVTPAGPEVSIPSGTSTPTPSPTPTESPTPTDAPTATPTETPSPTPTDSPTPTQTAESENGSPTDVTETTSGDGPGFGVLAALGAVGAGAWHTARSDSDEE